MKALLLAAGYGTRLKPYTDKIPKACMPFFGIPQILYNCELLSQAGVTDIIINTHHLADELVEAIQAHSKASGLNITFSHEPKLLNSGGGIKKTRDFFSSTDHFFVINADTMMLPKDILELKHMIEAHKKTNALVTMGTVKMSESLPDASDTDIEFEHRALWVKNNRVIAINKKQPEQLQLNNQENKSLTQKVKATGKDHISKNICPEHFTGCYVFSEKVFDLLPNEDEFHIFDGLIYQQIEENNVNSYFFKNTYWYETGNKVDFIRAHKTIINLLLSNSPNTALLKLAWQKYQPELLNLNDYKWAQQKLGALFK